MALFVVQTVLVSISELCRCTAELKDALKNKDASECLLLGRWLPLMQSSAVMFGVLGDTINRATRDKSMAGDTVFP